MLREITLENFKPFGTRQVAPLSRINLIFGPNSGGKSSLLQAMLLLKQTIGGGWGVSRSRTLVPRGDYADLGAFRSLIHRHEVSRELSIGLGYDPVEAGVPRGLRTIPGTHRRRVSLSFRAIASAGSRKKDSSELSAVRYILAHDKLRATLVPTSTTDLGIAPLLLAAGGGAAFALESTEDSESLSRYLVTASDKNIPGTGTEKAVDALRTLFKSAVFGAAGFLPARLIHLRSTSELQQREDEVAGTLRKIPETMRQPQSLPLERMAAEFEALLRSVSYLGPLRSHPARLYLVTGGGELETVGVRGEQTPLVLFRRPKEIQKDVSRWFGAFEIPYALNVKLLGDALTGEILALNLKHRRSKVQVGPSDVGFGIGQLLPIIVEAIVGDGRIVCVEQPEIHLHPKLQAHIADLMIETSGAKRVDGALAAGARTTQWIVETHSEAIIMRIQRRIREGALAAEDVSVLYVDPADDGSSRVLQLRLGQDGQFLDEWPSGFFEERFEELFGEAER